MTATTDSANVKSVASFRAKSSTQAAPAPAREDATFEFASETRAPDAPAAGPVLIKVRKHTMLALAVLGVIAVADALRPDALAVVRELKALGVQRVIMMSGDHHRIARHIAAQAGIEVPTADGFERQGLLQFTLGRQRQLPGLTVHGG